MLTDHSNPDIQLLSPSLTPSTGPSSQVQNDPPDFASAGAQDTSEPSLRKTYTRPQLLALHNSPLVQMPPNMPDLKDWFGTEIEQIPQKKDMDGFTAGNPRNNRYRRDIEDGDPSRQPFRTSLSQPQQMGNFKHQSLRPNDRERDRDKDNDKDKERDHRDRDGLRNLSDKYDRDRLAHPLSGRGKDRESAPHLPGNAAARSPSQAANGTGRSGRDQKKKSGEASEDWRRGAEPIRPSKDDHGRKERDERDRPRSNARDTSRTRRDSSNSRRDREDKDRETQRRGDRQKDDARRGRTEETDDDSRRWRDDGKRDERVSGRREKDNRGDNRERARDRLATDAAWDASDRRWNTGEDSRLRKSNGRERKSAGSDEKEREERKEGQREREPAWMDTYIPSPTAPVILGGKGPDGELDGIQAFKKGMREKELKEKVAESKENIINHASPVPQTEGTEKLDEIQLFKLMMKREEEKKVVDVPETSHQRGSRTSSPPGDNPHWKKKGTADVLEMLSNLSVNDTLTRSGTQTPGRSMQPSPAIELSFGGNNNRLSQDQTLPGVGSMDSMKTSRFFPNSTSQERNSNIDKLEGATNTAAGSRLLAFARSASSNNTSTNSNGNSNGPQNYNISRVFQDKSGTDSSIHQRPDLSRPGSGFSPFEEAKRTSYTVDDLRLSLDRPAVSLGLDGSTPDNVLDTNNPSLNSKGSRFAKFFDGKGKETNTPVGKSPVAPPPPSSLRQEPNHPANAERSLEDIFAMLSSSAQQRVPHPNTGHTAFTQPAQINAHHGQLPTTHTQPAQFHQQALHGPTRLDSLYDSRQDDRNLVPDGLVPGLRQPGHRNRDHGTMYSENLEDLILLNAQQQQRIPPQHRNPDPMYSGPLYAQHGNRPSNIPLQQPQYRGGPSPINPQLPISNAQQRLPPGLANLGGRPPHEPSQFMGVPGLLSNSLPSNIVPNGIVGQQQQQNFNNFSLNNNLQFAPGNQQIRPPLPGAHLIHGPAGPLGLGASHPNNIDLRNPNVQNPLLALGNVNPALLRGPFPPVTGNPQLHGTLAGLRQQQQLHPHMIPHLLPPQFQQQNVNNNQPTHDLMALLMGSPHRE